MCVVTKELINVNVLIVLALLHLVLQLLDVVANDIVKLEGLNLVFLDVFDGLSDFGNLFVNLKLP